MVDCGSLRCAQERRSIRRDLQSLSKKLPVILGLESIAALYVNSEEKDSQATSIEVQESNAPTCQDFQACSRCFYCEKKIPNVYKRIDRIIGDVRKGKENKGKICLRSLQDLMPFCLDFYTHGFGRELFSDSVKNYFLMASPDVQEEDQKLVQTKNTSQANRKNDELIVPYHMENKRPSKLQEIQKPMEEEEDDDNVEEEMKDPSLSEQMAMMYTMPSLLNGKRLKREPENSIQDQAFHFLSKDPAFYPLGNPLQLGSSLFLQHPDYNDLLYMRNPQDSILSPFIHSLPTFEAEDRLRDLHLAHIRRLHNLNESNGNHPRPAHSSQLKLPLLVNVVRKLVFERFMEIKKLHRKKQEERNESLSEYKSLGSRKTFPPASLLPVASIREECFHVHPGKREENLSSFYGPHHDADSLLKHFGKVNESSRIGDTLKDIIGKTISEKMKFRDMSSDENSNPDCPNFYKARALQSFSPVMGASGLYKRESDTTGQMDKDSLSPIKKSKKDVSSSRCYVNKSPSVGSPKSLKKTRPKRGQYRKYNSQLLMDAVRAVQRGEMSVHRAGSFFGVPHSTLEYKVKERHLLRPRKGRDSTSSASPPKSDPPLVTTVNLSRDSSPALSEASLTSKKFNEPSNSKTSVSSPSFMPNLDEKRNHIPVEKVSNRPLSLSPSEVSCSSYHLSERAQELSHAAWQQPFLSSSSQCDSAASFQASGLSLNTSASELLRMLQHKVQSKDSLPHEGALPLPVGKESSYEIAASKENSGELPESVAVFN